MKDEILGIRSISANLSIKKIIPTTSNDFVNSKHKFTTRTIHNQGALRGLRELYGALRNYRELKVGFWIVLPIRGL